jgi:hypothetical protein
MRRKPRNDKYKSNFERDVAAFFGDQVQYEPDKIPFTQPAVDRTYNPDFKLKKNVYLETKGKLTLEDRKKHIWIKEQHPEITIIFLFMNSNNTLTRQSKTTYAMWAEEQEIPWYCWRVKKPPQNIKDLIKQCISTSLSKQMKEVFTSKESSPKKKLRSSSNMPLQASSSEESSLSKLQSLVK